MVREQWLAVEGTPFALVLAVRTSPAVPKPRASGAEAGAERERSEQKLAGALFALDAKTGEELGDAVETGACPPLETLRTLTVLYRQGGGVIVRLGQGEPPKKPFAACAELYRAPDLAACTLRVPLKPESGGITSGPPQIQWGAGWLSAAKGRVDVARAPHAGLKLTSALRECLDDEVPVLALLEDRLALAGPRHLLLVSPELTSVCAPCPEAGLPVPAVRPSADELTKRARSAQDAWRSGRREQAVKQWGELFELWWVGDRVPSPQWLKVATDFGVALAAQKQPDQARMVLEEGWTMSKSPSVELLLAMGEVYRELGDGDAAMRAFERVLEVAPTRPQRERAAAGLAKLKAEAQRGNTR
ncbi:MAG: tetratricopeptide repeat protein [Myxococcaceae bacterium]|nr:tetratricopeptide repeat protein [Myxococcaceae bacterium]